MTLSELTIDDALEAIREETREETREQTWKEAEETTLGRISSLFDQGYSMEAIKEMARTNDPLYVGA